MTQPAGADPALVERYNGPTTSWSPVPNRFGVRVLQHERVRQDDQQGGGAELVQLTGPPGYSGMLLTAIGQAPVMEDLSIELRLRCDHPGVQPAVRVAFPREVDPNTGRYLISIVRGDQRALGARDWETLFLKQLPSLVRRHARALGSSLGHSIDERGAYVDAVVLIVPSDPRGSNVWIDELIINGLVRAGGAADEHAGSSEPRTPIRQVSLTQVGLTIDERKFFPRVVSHRGEPLTELRKLGFNTIAFDTPPDAELLKECGRLELHALCPAPPADALQAEAQARQWDGVLAWLLPEQADAHSLDTSAAVVESLRRDDAVLGRPLLARPTEAWSAWSRLADGLVVDPAWAPVGRMLTSSQNHFDEATRFARPGAPLLAAIPLTHSPAFMNQVTAFAPAGTVDVWRSPADVAAEATSAAMAGARGVWITSDAQLTGAQSDERVRLGLAMMNLRLTLLEPWLRDGERVGEVAARQPGRLAVIMSKSRTRLLIPQAYHDATPLSGPTSYIVPGVAEAAKSYEFTPVAMRPVGLSRMAGGAHVTLEDPNAWLLITEDNRAAAEVQARVHSVAQRAEALQQAIAIAELRHAEAHLSPLVLAAGARSPDAAVLAEARRQISHAKSAHSTGDYTKAFGSAVAACQRLTNWSRGRVSAANPTGQLDSSPLAGQAATIIDHHRLLQLIKPLTRSANLLPGGNFEDQQSAAASGWRHIAREGSGAAAVVSFAGESPAQGERCLRLECPAGPENSPASASVVITSPEVNLQAGQLIEITGMVRVDQASGHGRLSIVDSLGGEELGLVLAAPQPWRPFRLLRRATEAGPQRVSFSARGPITTSIDAVMIRTIELPSAAKAAVLGVPAFQRK